MDNGGETLKRRISYEDLIQTLEAENTENDIKIRHKYSTVRERGKRASHHRERRVSIINGHLFDAEVSLATSLESFQPMHCHWMCVYQYCRPVSSPLPLALLRQSPFPAWTQRTKSSSLCFRSSRWDIMWIILVTLLNEYPDSEWIFLDPIRCWMTLLNIVCVLSKFLEVNLFQIHSLGVACCQTLLSTEISFFRVFVLPWQSAASLSLVIFLW